MWLLEKKKKKIENKYFEQETIIDISYFHKCWYARDKTTFYRRNIPHKKKNK